MKVKEILTGLIRCITLTTLIFHVEEPLFIASSVAVIHQENSLETIFFISDT